MPPRHLDQEPASWLTSVFSVARVLRPLDLELAHLAAEGIAVDAEGVGRLREAAGLAREHPGDEALLEFAHRVLILHAAIDHLLDELFQAFGDHASSRPVKRRNASTYFSRVFMTTSSGSEGTGGCLFQRICSR